MRILSLIIITLGLFGSASVSERGKWIIDSDSRLLIYGFTNVNNFTCAISCYNNFDTLEYVNNPKACELIFERNKMSIPVRNFDCGNNMITKDFWQTLKADKYPNLDIRFISLDKIDNNNRVAGTVEIQLAGVSKRYKIVYAANTTDGSLIQLAGKQNVCFSDFDLKAPQKLMGLIQVKENLEVEFQLSLKPVIR